jgi:hypothetical protein
MRGDNRRTDAFGGATAFSGPTGENDCRPRAGGNGQRGISHYRFAQILW